MIDPPGLLVLDCLPGHLWARMVVIVPFLWEDGRGKGVTANCSRTLAICLE